MHIFVVGTGRCGTSTFYQACLHIKGFTVGHESSAGRIPSWTYPDKHIEISSQLVYGIPKLRQRYADAKWVHLIRAREPCVESLARQCYDAMKAFSFQWFQCDHPVDVVKAAGQFYDLTNELIEFSLSDLPAEQRFKIEIEKLNETGWNDFCAWLQPGIVIDEAVSEILVRRYNAGINRGRDVWV